MFASWKILCELEILWVLLEINLPELCMVMCQKHMVNVIISMFLASHVTQILVTVSGGSVNDGMKYTDKTNWRFVVATVNTRNFITI